MKYKCIVLVLSLLEMNTEENVIKRLMRNLPLDMLKSNLQFNYIKYI